MKLKEAKELELELVREREIRDFTVERESGESGIKW
jgi:hypothetical protein